MTSIKTELLLALDKRPHLRISEYTGNDYVRALAELIRDGLIELDEDADGPLVRILPAGKWEAHWEKRR